VQTAVRKGPLLEPSPRRWGELALNERLFGEACGRARVKVTSEMNRKRDIAVIGASLGGTQALCRIAASLPASFPGAILVVLHTAADSPPLTVHIVSRHTPLRVTYGRNGDEIRSGCIYVAPADHHLVVPSPGMLGLDRGPRVRYSRPAVDKLFESAAIVYGSRVVGIVLTGGGRDGTDGIRRIKEKGGLGIVQHPSEALNSQMPMGALDGGHADLCVSLDEVGPVLIELAKGTDVHATGLLWLTDYRRTLDTNLCWSETRVATDT
jgi:two-component system, chemotaxis family, protein-glutamate methylesterase/glutaminase